MKTWNLFFPCLLILIISSCQKETDPLLEIPDDQLRSSGITCDCYNYGSFVGGIPTYASINDFIEAYNCLEDCLDRHNDALLSQNSSLSEDDFNALFHSGTLDEWEPLAQFKGTFTGQTLFDVERQAIDNWIENDGVDWNNFPMDELLIGGDAFGALFNANGEAMVGGVLWSYDELESAGRPTMDWCTPIGWNSETHQQTANNRMIISGGLIPVGGLLSPICYIYGKNRNFRRRNGRWRRHRQRICIRTSLNVRNNPSDCNLIYTDPRDSGQKCRTRSSLSVARWNTSYPNIVKWYKRTLNQGAEGLASGTSPQGIGNTPY